LSAASELILNRLKRAKRLKDICYTFDMLFVYNEESNYTKLENGNACW